MKIAAMHVKRKQLHQLLPNHVLQKKKKVNLESTYKSIAIIMFYASSLRVFQNLGSVESYLKQTMTFKKFITWSQFHCVKPCS